MHILLLHNLGQLVYVHALVLGVTQMTKKKIKINRAPVLTLWAAIVAERLGYDQKESLTFGKAVAG